MLEILEGSNLEAETQSLEGFYDSVRIRAAGIDNAVGKQKIITELYEKFFKTAFPRQADALGIVYTPVEIVDFILRSVNDLLNTEFGASLSDNDVHVLDPFTGTGTFITRLLADPNLIPQKDLARKYTSELHANEITLLAYYIATANIEATHADRVTQDGHTLDGGAWEPFDGIVLADTFQMTEADDTLDGKVFRLNSKRADRQLALPITVIVGNPPYSVGQTSGNDNNANVKYPTLDNRIRETYLADRNRGGSNSGFDSYIRAIRWATDRIGSRGVIGFVTNGGFLEGNTADQMRRTLAGDFSQIVIFNLRGNGRTAGDAGRREGRPVFEFAGWSPSGHERKSSVGGSRATIAIVILVKNPDAPGPARVRYTEVDDYLSAGEKIKAVAQADLASVAWREIVPNTAGDWLNPRSGEFSDYPAIGDKRGSTGRTIFGTYTRGLETGRDAWVYGSSLDKLRATVQRTAMAFNDLITSGVSAPRTGDLNPTRISWTLSLKNRLRSARLIEVDDERFYTAIYRPFFRQHAYYDRALNHILGQTARVFPIKSVRNVGIYQVGMGSAVPFGLLGLDELPDLHVTGAGSGGQFFPRYTYEKVETDADQPGFDLPVGDLLDGYQRVDNVTDWALTTYRRWYRSDLTKDDIFAFVYGLLHSPEYRERFAADLKRSLPRIPRIDGDDFAAFRDAGQRLFTLHIGYEEVEPYPLTLLGTEPVGTGSGDLYGWFRVEKLKWGGKGREKERSSIVYNPRITITGIPEAAHGYVVGSRSGLEWIIDRYQVKTDKASGIVNDPNDWSREVGNPRYILDLIGKVTTVSVETVRIVESLPPLRIHSDQNADG
jgi:predicted helicase